MTLRDSKWGARDSIDVCHRVRESVQMFESVWAVLRGGIFIAIVDFLNPLDSEGGCFVQQGNY